MNYDEGREMKGGVIRQVLSNLASSTRLYPTHANPIFSPTEDSIFSRVPRELVGSKRAFNPLALELDICSLAHRLCKL